MRGQIHVTSEYGRGTKFFFTAIHGRSTEEEVAAAVKLTLPLPLPLTLPLHLTLPLTITRWPQRSRRG